MTHPTADLRRVVSRWQIVGLALNDVIGSGVYLLPAAAAAFLGPWSLWAVLLAGLAVSLLVLCFAEASSHFDQPGSAYLYARTAFGDFVAAEVGWMTWVARVSSVASLSVGFAQALSYLWPAAAGEYRNPRRDVPFALIVNITVVTLLYVAVQWVALGTLPNLGQSATPLADSAGIFLGSWAGFVLTLGAALSILGTNSNTVFAGPRYLLALARDGFGPAFLARIHPRFRTPANAVVFQTAIALPLALSGSFVALAELSVMARLATYLGGAAAVPVLRRKLAVTESTVRLPGGPLIPIAAILLTLGLASSATVSNMIAAGLALAVGVVLYLLRRR